jgi:glutamine synthetase
LKDTSHRTVYPVWSGTADVIAGLRGAGDVVMVADPATWKMLPWAPRSAWVICDLYFNNGEPVPLSTRRIAQDSVSRLASAGYDYCAGIELEFHVFRLTDPKLGLADAGQPGAPPTVEHTTQGYQYLTEARYDQLEPVLDKIRDVCQQLEIPIRTLEIEFGPSQAEITVQPLTGLAFGDCAVLLRAAIKQACRRIGYHATFMCRPAFPNVMSSGWHLHQSLRGVKDGANAFAPSTESEILSPVGGAFAAGLLRHAAASCIFTTPTINGYKRYRPYSLAPDRILCARDSRAAMLRVISSVGSQGSRIENRVGEPSANPYLYMASQILGGLDGIENKIPAPDMSEAPYESAAKHLPRHLLAAIDAFDGSAFYRRALGDDIVGYFSKIKRAELDRFNQEVTDWEQREYFDAF